MYDNGSWFTQPTGTHCGKKINLKLPIYNDTLTMCVTYLIKRKVRDGYAIGNNINIKRKLCRFDYVTIIYFGNNDCYYGGTWFSPLVSSTEEKIIG